MRYTFIFLSFILILTDLPAARSQGLYELEFSTYFGGSDFEHARDVFADTKGDIYICGGTFSPDFPTSSGAFCTKFIGGSEPMGPCDVFLARFSSKGSLIWSTYVGGDHYDRAYGIEVDSIGYVYAGGRAGPGFPMKNALQPTFEGADNGGYGLQNAFILKLQPDGADLVWSTYVGVGVLTRDIAVDADGDVYGQLHRYNSSKLPPASWFTSAYQKTPPGGNDTGLVKIKSDGTGVIWATWLGGTGDEGASSVRVDTYENVYLVTQTTSVDMPVTPWSFDQTNNGGYDFYVAKVSPDGSDLLFGTYLGGSGNEFISTHNLAVDLAGNVYAAPWTGSADYPVTPGAYQTTMLGTRAGAVTKLSSRGEMIASTFIGGTEPGSENVDGIYVDDYENIFISGETDATDLPVTGGAFQKTNNGNKDAFLMILSADFSHPLYLTYIGGSGDDAGRSGFLGHDGAMYLTGCTNSTDWPTKNAYQISYAGGTQDNILAKFKLVTLPVLSLNHAHPVEIIFFTGLFSLFSSSMICMRKYLF